jgi:exopolysaccharide biosynthesis polyprenyl glycosylphosphotransferase
MMSVRNKVFDRFGDSVIAFVFVVCTVIWADNVHPDIGNITAFLEMRFTLMNAAFAAGFTLLWVECFMAVDKLMHRSRSFLRRGLLTVGGCAAMTAVVGLYLVLRQSPAPVGLVIERFFAAAMVCQMLRLYVHRMGWTLRAGQPENVIILGSGRRASKAWRELRIRYTHSANLLGFVDDCSTEQMPPDIAQRYLCDTKNLSHYLLRTSVQRMVVATPLRSTYDMTQEAISIAESAGVKVSCLADSFTLRHSGPVRDQTEMIVDLAARDEGFQIADHVKRLIDIVCAGVGIIALSPLFLAIAIAIKVNSPGPVFFLQERYGFHRHRFLIWKFRSMVFNAPELMRELEAQNEAQGPIFKIMKDPRITSVGRVLRSLSLDELPQLWNVLRGEMSLVGPRPMSVRDVSLFSDAILMRRFSVKPGITGLWQVSGRSSVGFDKWIALDFRYIDEWSLALDLKILARTLPVVLKRTGAV